MDSMSTRIEESIAELNKINIEEWRYGDCYDDVIDILLEYVPKEIRDIVEERMR